MREGEAKAREGEAKAREGERRREKGERSVADLDGTDGQHEALLDARGQRRGGARRVRRGGWRGRAAAAAPAPAPASAGAVRGGAADGRGDVVPLVVLDGALGRVEVQTIEGDAQQLGGQLVHHRHLHRLAREPHLPPHAVRVPRACA